MPRVILTLLLLAAVATPAPARTLSATLSRIAVGGVELRDVRVRLAWPADAAQGELRIEARRIAVDGLGQRFDEIAWQCPLSRPQPDAWRCDGALRVARGAPMRLSLDLSAAATDAVLARGSGRATLSRTAAAPDLTRIDLVAVPVAWAQALLVQAWPDGTLSAGTVDGSVRVETPAARPLRIDARLVLSDAGLESKDGTIAVADLDARLHVDARKPGGAGLLVALDGELRGGDLLFGNTYVDLPDTPVAVRVDARQHAAGWQLPAFAWRDGDALAVDGDAALGPAGELAALSLQARSADLSALPARYLSGWLGLAGLSGLTLSGAMDARTRVDDGAVAEIDATLRGVALGDAAQRFAVDGIGGDLRYSTTASFDSELAWSGGQLYGLRFGALRLPLRSDAGALRQRTPVSLAMLGGHLRFDGFSLRPPADGRGLQAGFGLEIDALDLGLLAEALAWPAFRGTLAGRIPRATYADERLVFDGGLSVGLFDGRIDVSSLSMERPFGVAPTLSADLALHDLDLLAITEVFDFGSISGRLHGRIDALRLVDWTATAFDAELHTEPRAGVRQRISQRAVQDISSVGDASFVSSLQGQVIGLFDDFGYRRIGIACRLANEVCRMSGLDSAGTGFTIVEGAGVPKLQVVGFNRDVDWPTLLERLAAAASGDVAPVVE